MLASVYLFAIQQRYEPHEIAKLDSFIASALIEHEKKQRSRDIVSCFESSIIYVGIYVQQEHRRLRLELYRKTLGFGQ